MGYGKQGEALKERQAAQDANAATMGAAAPVERSVAKAQAAYSNSGWDLVDAVKNKAVTLGSLKDEELPAHDEEDDAPGEREVRAGAQRQAGGAPGEDQRREREAPGLRRGADEERRRRQTRLDQAILGSVKDEAAKKGFTIE